MLLTPHCLVFDVILSYCTKTDLTLKQLSVTFIFRDTINHMELACSCTLNVST